MNWLAIKHLADRKPQELIADLSVDGMSQADIAREIGVTQGRANQVRNDAKAGFRGQATVKLLALHGAKHPEQAAA